MERNLTLETLKKNNAHVRSALLKLSKKFPDNADFINKIGITYRRSGDFTLAAEAYSKALKIDHKNPRIKINHATSLALCNSWDMALREAKSAQDANDNPYDEPVIEKLIKILSSNDSDALNRFLRICHGSCVA